MRKCGRRNVHALGQDNEKQQQSKLVCNVRLERASVGSSFLSLMQNKPGKLTNVAVTSAEYCTECSTELQQTFTVHVRFWFGRVMQRNPVL